MPTPADLKYLKWSGPQTTGASVYRCGYCCNQVSSEKGYVLLHVSNGQPSGAGVFICPNCSNPTFVTNDGRKIPGSPSGNPVLNVPKDLNALYDEARDCHADAANTASVLLCRKILMNIAVSQGASEGLKFIEYVDFLSDKGFIPPNGKHWVDHIRRKGNEANHEVKLMTEFDSKELLVFVEMLLKFIFEFPNLVPKQTEPQKA